MLPLFSGVFRSGVSSARRVMWFSMLVGLMVVHFAWIAQLGENRGPATLDWMEGFLDFHAEGPHWPLQT